jgi:hypothetical protein
VKKGTGDKHQKRGVTAQNHDGFKALANSAIGISATSET